MSLDDPAFAGPDAEVSDCLTSRRLVGDPVDVVTGANTDLTVDFRLRGPLPLRWRRHYNSARNRVASSLGWGHTHDFDRALTHDLDGTRYTEPTGNVVPFPLLAVGEAAVSGGFLLRRLTESGFELVQSGQPVQDFEFKGTSSTNPLRRLRHQGAEIAFRYDAQGLLIEIIDSLGRSIVVEANSDGRIRGLFLQDPAAPHGRRALMMYEYDEAGNPRAARDLYNTALGFEWDSANRMTRRTDRRGYSFHFEYDEQGRCIYSGGDDGLFEVALEYKPDRKTTHVRRGDGGLWVYAYGTAGTLTQITDPYGGVTSFAVDDTGRVTEEIDENGNVTRLLYDGKGRHYARLDPLGYVLPTYSADPMPPDPLAYRLPETPLEWEHGQLLRKDEIRGLSLDALILRKIPQIVADTFLGLRDRKWSDNEAQRVDLDGDAQWPPGDQRWSEHEGSPRMRQWKYDPNGNLAEHQDRDGAVYRYVYQSWNALHKQIDPLGHATLFSQSCQGLVNRVEDPGGTVTEYVYDLKDRLVEIWCDRSLRERYRYDAAFNIIEKTDGRGQTLVTWEIGRGTLDRARRLQSGETHTFEYDQCGRIIAAVTPECSTTFTFDDDGRRLEDKRDGVGVVNEFEAGRLVRTTCLDRFRTSYSTDDDGSLVIADPTGARHRVTLTDAGVIIKQFAYGAREVSLFDAAGRCRHKAVIGNGEYTPWLRSFVYSPAGDLLAVRDSTRGTVRYRFDDAHRICEEILPDGTNRPFVFDGAGNLLVQPGLDDVQVAAGNRLYSANGDRFTYNDRDQIVSRDGPRGATRYEYNGLDMLVRCEVNGEYWTAAYDALCRRTQKTWRGEATTYYWDDFRLAAEVARDGSVRVYVYEDHTALVPFMYVEYATIDSAPESGRRYYIFTNQIGAPIRVGDDDGRIRWSAYIAPFGFAHVDGASSLEMPLRFPGHSFDPETGLHYNRFRYFSPQLGRYIQSDPAGLQGGLNVYSYPTDPLTDVDIDGLKKPRSPAPSRPAGKKGKGTPAGADANCPLATPGATQEATKPPRPTQVGDVGKYKDLKKGEVKGDNIEYDHIPSCGALLAKAEREHLEKTGKPMTDKERKAKKDELRDEGNCVAVPKELHKDGETHGGKNTEKKRTEDSNDLEGAAERDMAAHRKNADKHKNGDPPYDPDKLDKSLDKVDELNRKDGVY